MIPELSNCPPVEYDLEMALHHVVRCASLKKPCAALLDELRRLYSAAGEPLPTILRPPRSAMFGLDDTYTISADSELLRDL